jgi:dTDP-L-rhamnose 4-epimerase
VFEDGQQRRDFVNVRDVARACVQAACSEEVDGKVLNVGSGQSRTILDIAQQMARVLGKSIAPEITAEYRMGDVRHCYADMTVAGALLEFRPQVTFESGLSELAGWLAGQVARDLSAKARGELESRGLTL